MSVAASLGGDLAQQILTGSLLVGIPIAMLAGLVSFASPCVVPLVPGYLGYVSGMAGAGVGANGGRTAASRPRLILGALLFVLGFSVVFVGLGFLASSAGAQLQAQMDVLTRVLGVVIIVMGFAFMGAMPFLQAERRIHVSPRAGLAGAPLLGAAFGLGWTPCIGPTLSAVLTLGLNEASQTQGAILAFAYCLGLGLPFVILAVWFERSGKVLGWLRRHRLALMRVGGALLIVLGVALVTGLWDRFTGLLQGWIDGFWVAI
ncbi:cytochrome c biogenesis CcdA family protein [Demequina zhanjiangensis]|uniref:Cytochrome c biogenesis protein CcdA n=1 Tax=Demequina zhanjiangensis TaxID=3051659 RepID=A0ABT8FWW6_9MICO|nr:cytochrome c biogenesis protein CcdA [Demequina sp. SYSU T00b26]MDN4471386.1 cytochrome c biogenesis protein CcdA [Demequina sp. SYSU T00b26]